MKDINKNLENFGKRKINKNLKYMVNDRNIYKDFHKWRNKNKKYWHIKAWYLLKIMGKLKIIDKEKILLDVWWWIGFFSSFLSKYFKKTYCIEPSTHSYKIFEENNYIKNKDKIIYLNEYLNETKVKWDIIIFIDVFEHIPLENLDSVLVDLYNWLNEGGYLILSTPNVKKFSNKIKNFFWKDIVYISDDHVYEYTEKEVINILQNSWFHYIKTFFFWFQFGFENYIGLPVFMRKLYSMFFCKIPFVKKYSETQILVFKK